LNDNFTLSSKLPPSRIPNVNLDNHFFKLVDEFEARFPHGSPSLLDCESLEVKGDIVFGKNIKISGNVILDNSSGGQIIIPHDACIDENLNWD
jgi:UTP--glucose-1-phosphate uridylyltransferase